MLAANNQINSPTRWLYLFIGVHVIVWTLLPFFTRYTLPMDAMEGTIWGQHFQWGYDKNPFLNGWLTGIALDLGGPTGWAIYLFSQLSVGICFLATYALAQKILPKGYALLSVLLLEGVQYYNVHAIDFDDNTLELGLWALTILYFYNALRQQKLRDWLLTGVFAGLGMMTKYYTVMLLLPMASFMLSNEQARLSFKNSAFYSGLLLFLLILTPHIVWLCFNDFVTVNYALERVTKSIPMRQVNYYAWFAWQQLEAFILPVAMLLVLLLGKRPLLANPRINIGRFNWQFLIFVGLGPFLLTVIFSALMSMKLRAGWGEPLLSLWGIMLVAAVQPLITTSKLYRFMVMFVTLFVVTLVLYTNSLLRPHHLSSGNFPGQIIATTLTRSWHESNHSALPFVAGSRWVAGNIAFYSKDHPRVYIDWDKKLSPWIDENKVRQQGAIFVWDISGKDETLPPAVIERFRNLGEPRVMHFSWLRDAKANPVVIGVAFLPPA